MLFVTTFGRYYPNVSLKKSVLTVTIVTAMELLAAHHLGFKLEAVQNFVMSHECNLLVTNFAGKAQLWNDYMNSESIKWF